MKTVSVEVKADHLARLAQSGRPVLGLAELVWNALDADATEVTVSFVRSLLGTIDQITVSDNGHGISAREVEDAFSSLGGSWKRLRDRTRKLGRLLHGKEGKGRFRAFSLGERVRWITRYEEKHQIYQLEVTGSLSELGRFSISDPVLAPDQTETGTDVVITSVLEDIPDLQTEVAADELTEVFALYLTQYPEVWVNYAGFPLDPSDLILDPVVYTIDPFDANGRHVPESQLTIVEWTVPKSRSLYLCDKEGFTRGKLNPGVHAPGFHFTAYLRSDYIRELDRENALVLGDLHPGLERLVSEGKEILRRHFRRRAAEEARSKVEDWKKERIYPYEGEPKSILESAERQVFEVVAFSVSSYLPKFDEVDKTTKQLSFRLLRQALEENPRSLGAILQEVLNLPKETQDELAALLERTSLSAVIEAAKNVANRLDFLTGLEMLIFRPESRQQLQERSQLHRILANETWIFGEEFNISVDDQSLTEVLRKHQEIIRRITPETQGDNLEEEDLAPVLRADGSQGIIDLMLSRRIPQGRSEQREHLVIELKRPAQAINSAVVQQIESYGYAIQRDERFRSTQSRWILWAVSNRITEDVLWKMADPARGLLLASKDGKMSIFLRTWGEILEECRGRLTFFQECLRYAFDDETALAYLRRTHQKYLPDMYIEARDAAEAE